MESGIQSSFIPHDTVDTSVRQSRIGGAGLPELTLLIGIVALIASGALGVGVFLYQKYLETATQSKISSLQRAKSAFEPALIQEVTRLDDRMHAAEVLLGAHLAPTVFFDALQQATLTTVSFSSLNLQANDAQHIVISMDGIAQSVNSIALQADLFSKNGVITSPIFSSIERQADGVHFHLNALVNPTAINYVRSLNTATDPYSGQTNQGVSQESVQHSQDAVDTGPSPFGDTPTTGGTGKKGTPPAQGAPQR